jgi:hypothetical protein
MYKTMYIIECLDSEYNILNISNNNKDVIFLDTEKIITISYNYMKKIEQKIILLHLMLENNIDNDNDNEVIIIPFKHISYNDMKFVINFFKIDDSIIDIFFKDLNKNDQSVSSTNTNKMPNILKDFFNDYTITNTINISELKDIELDYNKLKYLEKITIIADYLQYDLLCDASQYKYADNIRIINRNLLTQIIKEKLIMSDEIIKINNFLDNSNYEINNIINFCNEISIIDYDTLQKFIVMKPSKDVLIEEIINQILYDLDQLY